MKNLRIVILFSLTLSLGYVQAQCSNALDAGTPTSTSQCYDFDAITASSGSSNCVGGGFGGSGTARIIRFCTNSSNDCIVFDISGLAGSNGTNYAVYTGCTGSNTLSGFTGEGGCYSNAANSVISTSNMNLSANTCYYMRVWTKDPPTSSSQICLYTQTPANDECSGAMGVDATVQATDNYCMTPGTSDPPPSQYCAGSIENNAWYTFTSDPNCLNPCDVVVTFSNINCNGGAAGFQIGYWTGTCGSLNYLGCTSGSGGTVTATITTTPGTQIIMGIDGNAGAFCEFGISATNVIQLPVGLFDFHHEYGDKGVELLWSTATENNNDFFTIERSSDGINYTELATVKGQGTSNVMNNYEYVDNRPNLGINYYRLSQTDLDGTMTYLNTIAVETNMMFEGLMIAPNPAAGNTQISFLAKNPEPTTIEILDIAGKIVHRSTHIVKEGLNKYSFDAEPLKYGMYFLRVSNSSEKREIKFMR